jgi:hypothetical protein
MSPRNPKQVHHLQTAGLTSKKQNKPDTKLSKLDEENKLGRNESLM